MALWPLNEHLHEMTQSNTTVAVVTYPQLMRQINWAAED